MRITYILLAIAILSLTTPIFADSGEPINLAIIADQASGLDKSPLISLLEVELSQKEGIQLLERAAIDSILQEQQLSAAALLDRNNAIKIGKLLRADAFIILSTEKSTPDSNMASPNLTSGDLIRVRVLETAHGLRLLDYFAQSDSNSVGSIVQKLESVLNKINHPDEKLIPVGIVDIHRVQLAEQYKMLERTLPVLLSVRLNLEPQIIMLEREDLKVLLDEKLMTEGEDTKFWSSAILIDGYIQPNNGQLEMHLNLKQAAGENLKSIIVPVEPNEPSKAIVKATTEITKQLQNSPPAAKWQPEQEAEQFYKQGQMLVAHSRYEEAFSLLETAHTLQVQNVYYTYALFERLWSIRRYIEGKIYLDSMGIGFLTKELSVCPYSDIELAKLVSILVYQIHDNYKKGNLYGRDIINNFSRCLGIGMALDSFSYFSNSVSVLNEQVKQINKGSRKIWIDTINDIVESYLKNRTITREGEGIYKLRLAWISSDDPNELIENIKNAFTKFILPPEFGGKISSVKARKLVLDQAFLTIMNNLSPESLERTYLKGISSTVMNLFYQYLQDINRIDNEEVNSISNIALAETLRFCNITEEIESDSFAYNTTKKLLTKLKEYNKKQNDKTKELILSDIRKYVSQNMTIIEQVNTWNEILSLLIQQGDIHNIALLNPGLDPFYYANFQPSSNESDARMFFYQLLNQASTLLEKENNDRQAVIALNNIKDYLYDRKGNSWTRNRESISELDVTKQKTNISVTMLLTSGVWDKSVISSRTIMPTFFENDMLWVVLVSKGRRHYNDKINWTTDVGLAGINLEQKKMITFQHIEILTPDDFDNIQYFIGSIVSNENIILSLHGGGIINFPVRNINGQKQLDNPKSYNQHNGLPSLSITSIAKADNDKLWVAYGGTEEESGLGLYDLQKEQWETIFCSTLNNDTVFNNNQPYRINSIRQSDSNTLYLTVSDNSINKPWESRLYKMDINTREIQYIRSFTSAFADDFETDDGAMRMNLKNLREENFLIDPCFDDLLKGNYTRGFLILSTGAIYENKLWARMGQSQILIVEKGKSFEDALIIDNNILDGKPVERFVSTPYGLVGIGDGTVGLIETENIEK